jgi:1-acyl-sn-glycerol-3-phosphate acyltransferase
MLARLHGHLVLVYTALTMVFFFLVGLPEMLFRKTGHLAIWFAQFAWSPSILWLAGARVRVEPVPPLPDGPLIFAVNHESALDILALLRTLPRPFRFVAKQELFDLPVFGWYMSIGGHVPVDRGNHGRAVAALRRAGQIVRGGTSLLVFAEGTRSKDGRILPFKKGPFVLAMEAGVPVVPVAISGAGKLNPKGRIAVVPGEIRIALGEPLSPADFADKTALLAEVRRRVIALHRSIGGLGGDEGEMLAGAGREGARPPAGSPGGAGPHEDGQAAL